ncbi:MAG: DnaJ C-terminal domain-containing protein, partial [Candidatus Peribacteraceae bacterium]
VKKDPPYLLESSEDERKEHDLLVQKIESKTAFINMDVRLVPRIFFTSFSDRNIRNLIHESIVDEIATVKTIYLMSNLCIIFSGILSIYIFRWWSPLVIAGLIVIWAGAKASAVREPFKMLGSIALFVSGILLAFYFQRVVLGLWIISIFSIPILEKKVNSLSLKYLLKLITSNVLAFRLLSRGVSFYSPTGELITSTIPANAERDSKFNTFFESLFRLSVGGQEYERQARDIHLEVTITSTEATSGVGRVVKYQAFVRCPECYGSRAPEYELRNVHPKFAADGFELCHRCKGEGRISGEKTAKISIPTAVDDGQIFQLKEQGDDGRLGDTAGDLILHVKIGTDQKTEIIFPETRSQTSFNIVLFLDQIPRGAIFRLNRKTKPFSK